MPISIYPYKENKQIKRLRVQSWFFAVSNASRRTPKELEEMLLEPNEKLNYSTCIWNKYKRGDVEPRGAKSEAESDSVVGKVEKLFPGTKVWLSHSIWRLLDPAPLEMSEIRLSYLSLPQKHRDHFVLNGSSLDRRRFWRKASLIHRVMSSLLEEPGEDTLAAILTIMREAEVAQRTEQFTMARVGAIEMLKVLDTHPILGQCVSKLRQFIPPSLDIVNPVGELPLFSSSDHG